MGFRPLGLGVFDGTVCCCPRGFARGGAIAISVAIPWFGRDGGPTQRMSRVFGGLGGFVGLCTPWEPIAGLYGGMGA